MARAEGGGMITDEELAELPEEPELAFVAFERIVRGRLYEGEREAAREEYGNDSIRLEYISKVVAAARVYGIEALKNSEVPTVQSHVSDVYVQFISDVDHITTQIRIQHAPRNRQNSVGLDANTKRKIHHHAEQIRAVIYEADLPEEKQEALYKKISSFLLEVDKNRTGLQAGMAIYMAVCDGIGQGFQKLEPARKMIDSIAGLLGRAKDIEDSLRPTLPPPAERKQLEAPRPQLTAPEPKNDDIDDEIPF
jgi:hypothetical protein